MESKTGEALGLMDPRSFKGRVRRALSAYSPVLRWYRRARPTWLWQRVSPNGKVVRRYVQEYGLEVRHGPFEGLQFPRQTVGRGHALPTKLLGSYERELYPALEEAARGDYDVFVEVGSGDGYYCVGFKQRSPATQVIGFESDPIHRSLSKRVAKHNDTFVEFSGEATPAVLAGLPPGKLFLMVDVEGYEVDLLDVEAVPRLRETTMLVELHDRIVEHEVTGPLTGRFERSHAITFIEAQPRVQDDWEEMRDWPVESAHWALSEGRSRLARWMLLKPL